MKKTGIIFSIVWSLLNGKKRAIGGFSYIVIDGLLTGGAIEPQTAIVLKAFAGALFCGGAYHAVVKSERSF